jgi:ankyrin repeat protein
MWGTAGPHFTALEWAARKGNYDIVKWLCEHGGADAKVGTPVLWACYTNNIRVAKLLVDDFGADPHAIDPGYGMAALHIAAENGMLQAVQWLVQDKGQDPNWPDRTGTLALGRARGSVRIAGETRAHRAVIEFLEGVM